MEENKKVFQIERHINLLDDKLKPIAIWIEDTIQYHRLPMKRFETLRYLERQKYLLSKGYSKTLNSRHLPNEFGKSEAVDYVVNIDGMWSWANEHKFYYDFLGALVRHRYGDKIMWGGDFRTFYDGPHYQLK